MCNDDERLLFTLPVKQGGLAIQDPVERCTIEYQNSRSASQRMINKVKSQVSIYDVEIEDELRTQILKLRTEKFERNKNRLNCIK